MEKWNNGCNSCFFSLNGSPSPNGLGLPLCLPFNQPLRGYPDAIHVPICNKQQVFVRFGAKTKVKRETKTKAHLGQSARSANGEQSGHSCGFGCFISKRHLFVPSVCTGEGPCCQVKMEGVSFPFSLKGATGFGSNLQFPCVKGFGGLGGPYQQGSH